MDTPQTILTAFTEALIPEIDGYHLAALQGPEDTDEQRTALEQRQAPEGDDTSLLLNSEKVFCACYIAGGHFSTGAQILYNWHDLLVELGFSLSDDAYAEITSEPGHYSYNGPDGITAVLYVTPFGLCVVFGEA